MYMNKEIILVCILLGAVILATIYNSKSNEGFQCMANKVSDIYDWRKYSGVWTPKQNPNNYVLRDDGSFTTLQGTPLPLDDKPMLLENKEGPSVNGSNAPQSLSVFSFNKSSPLCCYGPNGGYSTSQGCVCVTPEQQKWFSSVANNRRNGYVGID